MLKQECYISRENASRSAPNTQFNQSKSFIPEKHGSQAFKFFLEEVHQINIISKGCYIAKSVVISFTNFPSLCLVLSILKMAPNKNN